MCVKRGCVDKDGIYSLESVWFRSDCSRGIVSTLLLSSSSESGRARITDIPPLLLLLLLVVAPWVSAFLYVREGCWEKAFERVFMRMWLDQRVHYEGRWVGGIAFRPTRANYFITCRKRIDLINSSSSAVIPLASNTEDDEEEEEEVADVLALAWRPCIMAAVSIRSCRWLMAYIQEERDRCKRGS